MGIQLACLFAIAVSVLMPSFASADDAPDTHGVAPMVIYPPQPVPPNSVVRIAKLHIEPHGIVGRHCHSGDEIGIVTEGTVILRVGNAEDEVKRRGEWFKVAPGVQMTVRNDTDQAAQMYSVLVVDNDGEWLKHDPKNCLEK